MRPREERGAVRLAPLALEAIDSMPPRARIADLPDALGYDYRLCFYAVIYLCDRGLVAKTGGKLYLTERGKIALAIMRGKRARLDSSWREAA